MPFPVYNRGLVYHKVSNQREWGVTTTTPRQFKSQMLGLRQLGFSFGTIKDFDPQQNQILITFDDGYDCIKEFAAPVLEEVEGRATVFAITDYVGRKNSWDYFPEHKQVEHMSWSDLADLHGRGWEIGSHGRSHRRLIGMSPARIRDELLHSKQEIEDRIGTEVTTFCPPFNAWNSDLLSMIEAAGYSAIAFSYPLGDQPVWGGRTVLRLGVYIHDLLPLFYAKLIAGPLAPVEVLQQQLINLAGNGHILENWLKSSGK